MLQGEHSAILLTFIMLPFSIETFVMSIFKWPLKTGFTVIQIINLAALHRPGIIEFEFYFFCSCVDLFQVYVTIKGSMGFLPRQQLTKKRGCSKMCFVRASKETFHIQGPFLGWLEILTIEVG